MPEDEKEGQFKTEEEIKVEVPAPDTTTLEIVTTKRESPIKRHEVAPLKETHGMTTEADRFKET